MAHDVALRLVPDGGSVSPILHSTLGEYAARGIYGWLSITPFVLQSVLTCLAVLLIVLRVREATATRNWRPHRYFSKLTFVAAVVGMGLWAIHVLSEFGSPLDLPHSYLVLMTHTVAGGMSSPDELAALAMAVAFWFSELPATWNGIRGIWKKRAAVRA